jgi:coniferyl-aldehyde dehydrogenase
MGAVLAIDPRPGIGIMEEEIFGPILPIVPVDSVDQAIAYVNDRPRPLSLYYFDRSGSRQQKLLDRTMSGSVCMNDCMVQNTQEELPFGGVGNSGMGSYHGLDGFRAFSHQRSVFEQSRFAGTAMLYPPYGKLIELVMKLFIR